MERPDRVTQFIDARRVLRCQFIDIDQIKDQSDKQLADLGIPICIVGLLCRYIHDFKVWRRNATRSRVTPQPQPTTSSRPVAELVPKQKTDTDLSAHKNVDLNVKYCVSWIGSGTWPCLSDM
jgi:hypothetical protein